MAKSAFSQRYCNSQGGEKNPCSYFIGDMSDIWYEKVEDAWLEQIVQMVYECDRHIFLTLTKYPERMLKWLKQMGLFNSPKKHIWWGTSVENQQWADIRMPVISQLTEAGHNTFISVQPQLSKINFNLAKTPILWAVFGGESKPFGAREEARPCHIRWIEDGLEQCENAGFMERPPKARGPNSIRPWNQPTAFSASRAFTVS